MGTNGQINPYACPQYSNPDGCNGVGLSTKQKAVPGSGNSQRPAQTDKGDITDHASNVTDWGAPDSSGFQRMSASAWMEILPFLIALVMQLRGKNPGNNETSSNQFLAPVKAGGTFAASTAAPSVPTPGKTAQSSGASNAGQEIPVNGGGPNTITVRNNSNREQNYALFVNPSEGQTSSFDVPHGFVTLKPGESASFKLPVSAAPGLHTSGYVQQMNNYSQADYQARKKPDPENFKATRAEYTFDHDGTLWFNTSHILGYNAALTMNGNGQVAGSSDTILSAVEKSHPNLVKNVGGQKVIVGPQGFTAGTNMESARVLNEMLNHSSNPGDIKNHTTTYVLPPDDSAMRGGKGPGVLILDFGNA